MMIIKIKGIVHRTGWMMSRNVQRFEIMKVVFDFGAFCDIKTQLAEHFLDTVKNSDRQKFREALQQLGLGLENRLLDKVGLLSGGQRQALTMLMATMIRPEVLLLDEHIAALDPKTSSQILNLTQKIVQGQKLTTLMITHNMKHAISFGNRLIMLHQGRILLDLHGKEKENLTVKDLLEQFYKAQGEELAMDSLLLS